MKTIVLIFAIAGFFSNSQQKAEAPRVKTPSTVQGKWNCVFNERSGKKVREKDTIKIAFTVSSRDMYIITDEQRTVDSGRIAIDNAQKPAAIDIIHKKMSGKEEVLFGIYEIQGNHLTLCIAPPGKPRPIGFATNRTNGHALYKFNREK